MGYLNQGKLSVDQRRWLAHGATTVKEVADRRIGLIIGRLVDLGLMEKRKDKFVTTARGKQALAQNLEVPR